MNAGDKGRSLRVGIAGLGGAAVNMLPAFSRSPHFEIAAAADVDPGILTEFKQHYPQAETFTSVDAIAADAAVDLIYIATPTVLHAEHARAALRQGKHVLIEKPMAVTLDEADAMIDDAERNGVLLGVNVKHSFEPRIRMMRRFVRSGELGRLRMLNSWRFVDWLYRPRTPEELTPGWGSGILWRQGPHQFDIVRTICGGVIRSVRGSCHIFDPARRVTGAFSAFLEFENDVAATVVCSGYDHFDSRIFVGGFDGAKPLVEPGRHARARRELASHAGDPAWEATAAAAERFGGGRSDGPAAGSGISSGWLLGGPLIASFERADVRLSRAGLVVDGDEKQWEIEAPKDQDGRDGRLASFYHAVVDHRPLAADGRWGKATQEALVAVERSSETHAEVPLSCQVSTVDDVVNFEESAPC